MWFQVVTVGYGCHGWFRMAGGLRVMGLPSDCSASAAVGATIHDNQ